MTTLDTASETTPAERPQPEGGRWRHHDRAVTAVLGLVAVGVGLAVRWWLVTGRGASWWQDSDDYLDASTQALWSVELWAGRRSAAVPLLLKATGGRPGGAQVWAQVVLAALCWGWLAVAASRPAARVAARAWAAGAVVAFSLVDPVTMWDRSILSESPALSLLAALAAAAMGFLRRPSAVTATVVVAVALAWSTTRDTNVVTLAVAAAAVGAWALLPGRSGRPRVPDRWGLAVGGGLLCVALLGAASASAGGRGSRPLANVYAARILPYPERVQWFADHGMPQGDRLQARAEAAGAGDGPPVVFVPGDDPSYAAWRSWFRSDGRSTFVRWVLEHPGYLVGEPLRDPERAFNNAEGDIDFYAPSDRLRVPFVTEVLWISTPTTCLAAALSGRWLWGRRGRGVGPSAAVGLVGVAAAGPGALAAWHGDAMETARHLHLAGVEARLGLLLIALGAISGCGAWPAGGASPGTATPG